MQVYVRMPLLDQTLPAGTDAGLASHILAATGSGGIRHRSQNASSAA